MSNFQAHFLSFWTGESPFVALSMFLLTPRLAWRAGPWKVFLFSAQFFSPTEMTKPTHNLAWRRKGQRGSWWENSSHLQSAQVLRLKLVLNISEHCWSLPHTACEENLVSKVSKITQTTGKSACVYPLLIGPLWNCALPFCLSSITSHFSTVASCNWATSSESLVFNFPHFQNLVIFFELCLLPMSVSAPATPAERQSAARYLCGWN